MNKGLKYSCHEGTKSLRCTKVFRVNICISWCDFVFLILRSCFKFVYIILFTRKINLFAPNPKGCKLIFNTPFRGGAMLKINIRQNIISNFKQPFSGCILDYNNFQPWIYLNN